MSKTKQKLERCPVCGCKPLYMRIDESCGYVLCNICLLQTKRCDDFIESWKEQATQEWNKMVKERKQDVQNYDKKG